MSVEFHSRRDPWPTGWGARAISRTTAPATTGRARRPPFLADYGSARVGAPPRRARPGAWRWVIRASFVARPRPSCWRRGAWRGTARPPPKAYVEENDLPALGRLASGRATLGVDVAGGAAAISSYIGRRIAGGARFACGGSAFRTGEGPRAARAPVAIDAAGGPRLARGLRLWGRDADPRGRG